MTVVKYLDENGLSTVWSKVKGIVTPKADKVSGATAGDVATLDSNGNLVDSGVALSSKQDTLTFDNAPTANSNNPVKSSGIKTAIDAVAITAATVTVDNNSGTPSATATVSNGTLSLAFTNLKGATGATGPQGPQGIQGPQGQQGNPGSSVDYPFTLENSLDSDSTTTALTAAQGKELKEMFGSGYIAEDYFVNSADASWETANVNPGGQIVTSYQNQILVIPLTAEAKASGRMKLIFGPSPTYNLGAYVSASERSGYTTIVASLTASNAAQIAEMAIPNTANYLLLVCWDKPSAATVKALYITIKYEKFIVNNPVLRQSDLNFLADTTQDGFFVIDRNLNIGFKVDALGVAPGGSKGNPLSIFIAAADSSDFDKRRADYVCGGYHDEVTIQEAINALSSCGEVILARGTYGIDGFYAAADGHLSAITIPDTYRPNYRIKIAGAQDSDRDCIIRVSQTCYNNLASDTQYSVFSATNHVFADYSKHVIFENLYVEVPANKKQIICFDGWNFGSMRLTNCWANNAEAGNYLNTNLTSAFYGVAGCIGFRGTQGSNNAIDMLWTNCTAQGLGIGFAVSGEHLVMTQCASVACKYGYTFNYYAQNTGAYTHPITLINCCDERSENLPYFGKNGEPGQTSGKQAVTFIDFNIERLASDAIVNLAMEQTIGAWRGSIDYSFQASYGGSGNTTDKAFWAAGHGYGVRSRNQAQLQAATTSVRNGYAPNYCQQLFDTTLSKLAICIDPANKTWVDTNGNTI